MKNTLFLIIAAWALVSCGPSVRVYSDYDKSLNISNYKTFSWLDMNAIEQKGTDPRYMNELTDKRIKLVSDSILQAAGLHPAPNADMEMHYHIVIDNKTMTITEPYGARYNRALNKSRTATYQYKEGTLIIDMMDTKTHELIWRGWATDVITEKEAKDPETAIRNAVGAIMARSPFVAR